jgi:hypothetical protein
MMAKEGAKVVIHGNTQKHIDVGIKLALFVKIFLGDN